MTHTTISSVPNKDLGANRHWITLESPKKWSNTRLEETLPLSTGNPEKENAWRNSLHLMVTLRKNGVWVLSLNQAWTTALIPSLTFPAQEGHKMQMSEKKTESSVSLIMGQGNRRHLNHMVRDHRGRQNKETIVEGWQCNGLDRFIHFSGCQCGSTVGHTLLFNSLETIMLHNCFPSSLPLYHHYRLAQSYGERKDVREITILHCLSLKQKSPLSLHLLSCLLPSFEMLAQNRVDVGLEKSNYLYTWVYGQKNQPYYMTFLTQGHVWISITLIIGCP